MAVLELEEVLAFGGGDTGCMFAAWFRGGRGAGATGAEVAAVG